MRFTVELRRYRQLAIITTVGICLLTVAGGVVRLTGSGLGCDDWPNCNETSFIDVSSGHAAIEQVNRLFSGLIGIPTLALAIASFRVRPQRPGLRWPAIGVLVTVLGNGVVGGLAVRGDLHPVLVQSHFLLAMLSIGFGMVAIHRSTPTASDPASTHIDAGWARPVRSLTVALTVGTAAALVTGTVVTGTGPHAGEEDVRRFGFDISNVARTHSVTVIVTVVIALALAWTLRRAARRSSVGGDLTNALSTWLFVALVQGGIGYVQYFNGVPELLVGVHILGATVLWVATLRLALRTWAVTKPADGVGPTLADAADGTDPAAVVPA